MIKKNGIVIDDNKISNDVSVNILNDEFGYIEKDKSCISIVRRVNCSRPFLFLNKYIGKHFETNPSDFIKAGFSLAQKLYSEVSVVENTLFVGFAETATGLGSLIALNFEKCWYQETTRFVCDNPSFDFLEEHSHAPNQILYKSDEICNSDRVVFIEDELTTGKTLVNIITKLKKELPNKEYFVLTFLDMRDVENKNLENMGIKVLSLIRGTASLDSPISYEQSNELVIYNDIVEEIHLKNQVAVPSKGYEPYYKPISTSILSDLLFDFNSRLENLFYNEDNSSINNFKSSIKDDEPIVVLGLGASIFLPTIVADSLTSIFESSSIFIKSTSRTPICIMPLENYEMQSGIQYESNGVIFHLYNYKRFKNVVIVYEKSDVAHFSNIYNILKNELKLNILPIMVG